MNAEAPPLMNVLLLHPGEMGESIGAALASRRQRVLWLPEGRSLATLQRAENHGFTARPGLHAALLDADWVLSICPPHAAFDVAAAVAAAEFKGIYVDCNAISPATMSRISALGMHTVDGGIIGPPAWRAGTTRLWLSGEGAAPIAAAFDQTLVDARVCGAEIGAASALKMAYAGWTKGSSALLLAMRALAERAGVADALEAEWEISQPGTRERVWASAGQLARKAWRFEGEMTEIERTMADSGLPPGFHRGAADLYARLATLKDQPADLEILLSRVLATDSDHEPSD